MSTEFSVIKPMGLAKSAFKVKLFKIEIQGVPELRQRTFEPLLKETS